MALPVTAMNTVRKNLFNVQPAAPAVQPPPVFVAPAVLQENPGHVKQQLRAELNGVFGALDTIRLHIRTNLTENTAVATLHQLRQSTNALNDIKSRIFTGDMQLKNLAAHVTRAQDEATQFYAQQLRNLVLHFAHEVAREDGTMTQEQVQARFNIYAEAFALLNEFLQRDPQYQPTLQGMEAQLLYVKETLE